MKISYKYSLVLFGLVSLSGCASKKIAVESGSSTLAAQTKVEVHKTSNGNSEVKLKVKHLTPPEKVSPGATTYVVWAQAIDPKDAPMMNIGGLKPNKDLEAEFKSVTPYRKFKIALTPEKEQSVAVPTTEPVLWTDEVATK